MTLPPIIHNRITGYDAIHELMWIGSSDPAGTPANDVQPNQFWIDTTNGSTLHTGAVLKKRNTGNTAWDVVLDLTKQAEVFLVAVSDETTAITTGTAKMTFRMPFAFSITTPPRANLNTASSSGNPAIDVKKTGTSIFSTTITIDSGEKTSLTAATPAVLSSSPTNFSDDEEVTIDINTAGTGAKGLKLAFIGSRT